MALRRVGHKKSISCLLIILELGHFKYRNVITNKDDAEMCFRELDCEDGTCWMSPAHETIYYPLCIYGIKSSAFIATELESMRLFNGTYPENEQLIFMGVD